MKADRSDVNSTFLFGVRRKVNTVKSCRIRVLSGIVGLCAGVLVSNAQAAFQLVEDFDNLTLGNVDGQNSWVDTGNSGQVVVDPDDGATQALVINTESGVLHRPLTVVEGASRMLFLRFRFQEHGAFSFGLSPLVNPDEYSDFSPELGMAAATTGDPNNDLRVANGSTFNVYDVLEALTPSTWYNVWVMVDTSSNTYQVWLNADPGGAADSADLLDNDAAETVFGFRVVGSGDLLNFFIKTGGGASPVDGRFYLDDIYLENTDSLNLNNPAGSNSDRADLVIDFGGIGLWGRMNDSSWLKLNNSSPDRVVTGDMDGNGNDDVIADFASTLGGIFVKYNLGGWTQLFGSTSEQMASGDLDNNGKDDVVIDFGVGVGLWARMNDASWLKLNNGSPEQVVVGDMDNNGADDVIADFGAGGIFVKRNLGGWVKLHNNDPEDMTIGNLDNAAGADLVVDFAGSIGLQARMNDSSWLKLHNGSPDVMTTGDIDGNGADDVLAGFGSTLGGFWQKLNLGGWDQLNANSPDDVVTGDVTGNGEDDIVADFGTTVGGLFVKRDQGGWVKLHNTSPDSMTPGELDGQ